MSIRGRIFAVIGLVVAASLVQSIAVVHLEQQRAVTNAGVDHALWLFENQALIARTIPELQAAQMSYLATGTAEERHEYERLWNLYERTIGLLPQYMDDREQRARLADLDRQVREWHTAVSLPLMARRERGEAVTEALTELGPPRTQRIAATLDQLESRQRGLLMRQRLAANSLFLQATLVTLAIPAVAIIMLLILVAVLARILLDPLATIAGSARQISAGNFNVCLPAASRDELGALVKAFRDMTGAVQRRQRELTEALSREREISQMYATLRTKAEQEHARLLATIATVPAALIILDVDGRIILQNKAAEELVGGEPPVEHEPRRLWRQHGVLRKDGSVCPPGEWGPSRALAGEVVVGQELIVRHPDGRSIPILVSAAPLVDEKEKIIGAVAGFQDITTLYEIDRVKSEFVSVVSHELRTPLTSIKGSLQLLLAEGERTDRDHLQLLNVALTNTDRLIRIINDILDISKIEAGRLTLHPKPVDVHELVRASMLNVDQIARDASVTLVSDVAEDLPPVMADPDRTVQAIVNLLSNALKYAPGNTNVTVAAGRQGEHEVWLSVTDRGRGIPADKIGQLFQKFQQIDGSDSRKLPGTGLGLAITKALIEQQGGRITVTSEMNQGTTFSVLLPSVTDTGSQVAAST